jgi:hypothetical protein
VGDWWRDGTGGETSIVDIRMQDFLVDIYFICYRPVQDDPVMVLSIVQCSNFDVVIMFL